MQRLLVFAIFSSSPLCTKSPQATFTTPIDKNGSFKATPWTLPVVRSWSTIKTQGNIIRAVCKESIHLYAAIMLMLLVKQGK